MQTVLGMANGTVPMSWIVFLIVTVCYMLYGLQAIRTARSAPDAAIEPGR